MVAPDLYSLQVVAHYALKADTTLFMAWLVVLISAVPICLVTTGWKGIVEKVAGGLQCGVD